MEKSAPCMAITEKKDHRKNGCMNILFHFFEWNRKLPNKKKLLLRAGEEQVSKRFRKNEKMPKPMIHPISDGYTGSFFNFKESDHSNVEDDSEIIELNPGSRSPGLVARLMGLESMPAIPEGNLNRSSSLNDEHTRREEKPPDDHHGSKLESRSQKTLKTGISNKQAMARFRQEGLIVKDVLSRAKRHNHHQKLPSQLKSARLLNSRDGSPSRTSRLIHVATKILEPGLQAKNKAKCSLTTPDSRKQLSMGENLAKEQCVGMCPASASHHMKFLLPQYRAKNKVKPVSMSSSDKVERNRTRAYEQVSKRNKMHTVECNSQSGRVSPASRASASGAAKDFTLNRSLSSKTDVRRSCSRTSRSKFDTERRFCFRQGDSLSPSSSPAVKKRGNVIANGRFQSSGYVASHFRKEKNVKSENGVRSKKDTELRSKTHQSSLGVTSISASGDTARGTRGSRETSQTVDEERETLSLERGVSLNGDALGALLERTVKELTYEDRENPKKPTAMILQELISALTSEQLVTKYEHIHDTDISSQAEAKNQGSFPSCIHGADHFSPGCVLEDRISNNSCITYLNEESSGDTVQSETDAQDSAGSTKQSCFPGYRTATDLADSVSQVMISMNEACLGLKGSHFKHVEDVILNTELLFWDTSNNAAVPSLVDQLAILNESKWRIPGFEEIKENDQFTQTFVINSMVECLESKYCMYGDFGFNKWRQLTLPVNVQSLIREEINRWTTLAGMGIDEIIEREIDSSLGKWRDVDAEIFNARIEISADILQDLVEEFVMEL